MMHLWLEQYVTGARGASGLFLEGQLWPQPDTVLSYSLCRAVSCMGPFVCAWQLTNHEPLVAWPSQVLLPFLSLLCCTAGYTGLQSV